MKTPKYLWYKNKDKIIRALGDILLIVLAVVVVYFFLLVAGADYSHRMDYSEAETRQILIERGINPDIYENK